jgi:iron-sulfur cluster insertion protein
MNAPTEMPAPIIFTDSAANKFAQLIDEEGNPDLSLLHAGQNPDILAGG